MEHKIIVVGIGPGAKEYILPAALSIIKDAKILIGSKRALADYAQKACITETITGDIEKTMQFIAQFRTQNDVVIMVSGDPGYYSLLVAIRKKFSPEIIQVIPGISSMQLAFAKLALPWQDARLISLHGRKPNDYDISFAKEKVLGILTDTVYTSKTISKLLIEYEWPQATCVYCCTRLSYADEQILKTTLEDAVHQEEFTHCIMVVIG